MFLEAVDLHTEWLNGTLKDASNRDQGVNALLADPLAIPRTVGDPQPTPVTAFSQVRDFTTALGKLPKGSRVIAVRLYREVDLEPAVRTTVRDLTVPLTLGIAVPNAKPQEAERDASYILRAAMRSLREFQRNEQLNAGKRTRNGFTLLNIVSAQLVPVEGTIGELEITTAVRVDWRVRDDIPDARSP